MFSERAGRYWVCTYSMLAVLLCMCASVERKSLSSLWGKYYNLFKLFFPNQSSCHFDLSEVCISLHVFVWEGERETIRWWFYEENGGGTNDFHGGWTYGSVLWLYLISHHLSRCVSKSGSCALIRFKLHQQLQYRQRNYHTRVHFSETNANANVNVYKLALLIPATPKIHFHSVMFRV